MTEHRQKTGGRQPGTPNRRTLVSRRQLADRADPLGFLVSVMEGELVDGVQPTLADRLAAARELRRVIVPDCREAPVSISLPQVNGAADLPAAMSAILSAVADGDLTTSQGKAMSDLLDTARKAFEAADLAARIAQLEARL